MIFSSMRISIFAASAFILLAIAGCKSSSTTPIYLPPTSALSGRVLLYSGAGSAIVVDTGVTVSVNGLQFTVNTNDSGEWLLPAIATGSYTLTFSRSGFGTVMQFGDSVTANDTTKLSTVVMSEAPTDGVGFAPFQIVAPNTLIFDCKMPAPSNEWTDSRTIVCCVSTDSASLAANPYEAPWIFASVQRGSGYDGSFTIDTTISEASIANDTIIYACVCIAGEGTNYQSFSHYYDPVTMQEVYSALGPRSQILSAKLH
jgi:hypothetical protein